MTQWYILRVKGGQEEKIKTNIESVFLSQKIQDVIKDIKVVPYVNKKTKTKKDNNTPTKGSRYLCIAIDLEGKPGIKEMVNNIDGVYGFVGLTGFGSKQEPIPVSDREINQMLQKSQEATVAPVIIEHSFVEGQKVKVVPLGDRIGTIKEVLTAHKKLIVVIQLFQQDVTEVEVGYGEVKKLD